MHNPTFSAHDAVLSERLLKCAVLVRSVVSGIDPPDPINSAEGVQALLTEAQDTLRELAASLKPLQAANQA